MRVLSVQGLFTYIFFHSNYTSSDELDLHGLHVDEAITALQEKLTSCKGDIVCSVQHVFGTLVVVDFVAHSIHQGTCN